ncbi:MAG: hypothetical protein LW823_09645 [Rickettsiales bacterium]|jgi:hypothetical protein|nr:hypothetical protein [Rickettsiales bacterium]
MKRISTFALAALASFPALANEFQVTFECTRFKSNCVGAACHKIYEGLQQDTGRTILAVRKTQVVEYVIDPARAVETIKTVLANDKDRDQNLVIEYQHVLSSGGRITLSNQNAKKVITERAVIDTTGGLYSFYLLHTDGSIKDVPVGEPYTAYFGWCENKSAPGAALPDMTPQSEPAAAQQPAPAAPAVATNTAAKP